MVHSRRIPIFFIAVVLLPLNLVRADNLSGRIVDPQGNVVPDATINLFDRNSGEQRTTVSSKQGGFNFPGLPQGNYLLEAEASNAALIASEDIAVHGDQNRDVSLKVAGVRAEIVVTASGTPLQTTEVAKAIDIVDSRQLDLRDTFEIAEAVRALPGLQVQTLEGPGSFTTINTRGMRAVDTAVLIDGMRFRDAASVQNDATAFLGNMTAVDLDRVEFMRCACS